MSNKNYFITGGSGFLGKNFFDILKKKNLNKKKIFALSRRRKKNLKNLFWIKGDLKKNCKTYLKKTHTIFHFMTSLNSSSSLENFLNIDFIETFNFFEKARKCGVKNFFFIGSSFEIGFNIKNKNPLLVNPINDYAFNKVLNLILLKWWSKKYNLNINYGRVFQMYGEYESVNRLFPYVRKQAIKNKHVILKRPKDKRDFIDVTEVCETIYKNINKFDQFRIINICRGKSQSIENFSKKIWGIYNNSKIKYKYMNKVHKPLKHIYGNKKESKIKNFKIELKI